MLSRWTATWSRAGPWRRWAPFIIEGAFQGGFASVLSMAMLAAIYLVVTRALPDVTFLSPSEITLYVTTCVLLGAVGSYAALRRLIRL